MALRTDERVVEYINQDAIITANAKPRTLALDQVLTEIEMDENYQQQ